jgi:hypothetical protein
MTTEMFSIAVYDEEGHVVAFRQVDAPGPFAALQQLTEQGSLGNVDYGLTTATAPTTIPAPAYPGRVFVVLSHETDPDRIEFGEVRTVHITTEPPEKVESHQAVYECEVNGPPKAYRTS